MHKDAMNFDIVGASDIWNKRRNEGEATLTEKMGHRVKAYLNNKELYDDNKIDAVIISTADFQHALHTVQAAWAGKDVYVEKPFAETMEDNKAAIKAVKKAGIILQVGSQRRSGKNYHAAKQYIDSGQFGDIVMVAMTWNVNQPGRWRRLAEVAEIKESDTDWKRYLMEEYILADSDVKVVTSADTGADNSTSMHMLNWMECIWSRKQANAPVEAGYNHSIANIMTTAALRTGEYVTFDEKNQEVLAGGKIFKY